MENARLSKDILNLLVVYYMDHLSTWRLKYTCRYYRKAIGDEFGDLAVIQYSMERRVDSFNKHHKTFRTFTCEELKNGDILFVNQEWFLCPFCETVARNRGAYKHRKRCPTNMKKRCIYCFVPLWPISNFPSFHDIKGCLMEPMEKACSNESCAPTPVKRYQKWKLEEAVLCEKVCHLCKVRYFGHHECEPKLLHQPWLSLLKQFFFE